MGYEDNPQQERPNSTLTIQKIDDLLWENIETPEGTITRKPRELNEQSFTQLFPLIDQAKEQGIDEGVLKTHIVPVYQVHLTGLVEVCQV